jgi:hypothetical protein
MPYYSGNRVSDEWHDVLSAADNDRGRTIHVTDGKRSILEQAARYARYLRYGYPIAAKPWGGAPHIKWGAIDHALDINALNGDADWFDRWCTNKGFPLLNTVRSEPWHKEIRGGARALRALSRKVGFRPLRYRSTGKRVKAVQRKLRSLGFKSVPGRWNKGYGFFGEDTVDALKRFQRKHKLGADGVVGPKTWKELF